MTRRHTCHAPHCKNPCRRQMLFCRPCWEKVSPAHQEEVLRAFRACGGVAPIRRVTRDYLAATAEARADVMEANGRDASKMRAAAERYRNTPEFASLGRQS